MALLACVLAVFRVALVGLGLDRVLQARYPDWNRGSFSAASAMYVTVSAVIMALAWGSVRRGLPRRIHGTRARQRTLGAARGSLLWVWMLVLV